MSRNSRVEIPNFIRQIGPRFQNQSFPPSPCVYGRWSSEQSEHELGPFPSRMVQNYAKNNTAMPQGDGIVTFCEVQTW